MKTHIEGDDILKNFSRSDLEEELERRERSNSVLDIMSPVGLWRVTTEGDCEGRTVKDLGVHEGHIVDIARSLSSNATYELRFKAVEVEELPTRSGEITTAISLDIKTGTWDLKGEDKVEAFRTFLVKECSNASYKVTKQCTYAGIEIKTW